MARRWHLLPHDRAAIDALARALQMSPVVAQLLLNRGVRAPDDARRFLDSPLTGLHPPERLPGVSEAAERIARAVADKRKVCIYGDYDVDGVTGTAVLVHLFRALGVPAVTYLPSRLEDGYGLSRRALQRLADDGVKMVVTVDCGIAGVSEADEARRLGLELIITDHHEPKDRLPDADVLVHPRLPGSTYPFGGLSGAGVAFKLAWAVAQRVCGGERVTPKLRECLLDGVALATLGLVADVMPLLDENRVFVRHGLARLRASPLVGLAALLEVSKLGDAAEVRAEDIAFRLAPRINAAGRLGAADAALDLLTTSALEKARGLAMFLDQQNTLRQELERRVTQQVRDQLVEEGLEDLPAIVMAGRGWHPGIVGIVAGRLADQYAKPVLLAALRDDGGPAPGSGRSAGGLALHEALKACSAHLVSHGGHAAAAGFRVRPEDVPKLREVFCEYVVARFPEGMPPPELRLDAEVHLAALTSGLLRDLDRLEPYGMRNPKPVFLAGDLEIVDVPRRMGKDEKHLNFKVRQGGTWMRAVAFGMGDRFDELMSGGGRCCLAFTPKRNEWNGSSNIELMVTDFQAGRVARLS